MNHQAIRPSAGSHLEQAAQLAVNHNTFDFNKPTARERVYPRSNVIAEEAHVEAMSVALTSIARIVARTLGPHGSNALVLDENGSHFATKDGYTVLTRMTFVQDTTNMVLDHVRSVSRAMVRKVGDGSTSAVIMADRLFKSILDSGLTSTFPPGVVQSALNIFADVIAEYIAKSARPVVGIEDLRKIATISANNNPWAGNIIAEAYTVGGVSANVTVVTGGETTEVSTVPGYRVLRGMAHECFATITGTDGVNKTTTRMSNAAVMILDSLIDQTVFSKTVAPVMNECIKQGTPFVLVAREYTGDVIQIVANFIRSSPGVQILLVDHAAATRRGAARLGDLAAVLGCEVAHRDDEPSSIVLGKASAIYATMSETLFTPEGVSTRAEDRAVEVQAQYDRVDTSNHDESMRAELDELLIRIRALRGSEVTIHAGGATEQEKKTMMYLLDDAVLAVAAAKRSGIVDGLNLTPQRIINEHLNDIYTEVNTRLTERSGMTDSDNSALIAQCGTAITMAYEAATLCVLDNARVQSPTDIITKCIVDNVSYNALQRSFSPVAEATVVNPAATDIEVLRGAMSIVALLLTSNQTLLTRPAVSGGLD